MAEADWRTVVTNQAERRIFEALEDRRWEWRTVRALSQASGLSTDDVRRVLSRYPSLVRKSVVPGISGDDLYTLQARHFERKSPLQKAWDFLSSSSSST